MKKTSRTKEETHKGRDAKIIFTVEKILADEKLRQKRKIPEWMVELFAEMGLDIYNLPPLNDNQKKEIKRREKELAAMPKSERTLMDFEFSLLQQRVRNIENGNKRRQSLTKTPPGCAAGHYAAAADLCEDAGQPGVAPTCCGRWPSRAPTSS